MFLCLCPFKARWTRFVHLSHILTAWSFCLDLIRMLHCLFLLPLGPLRTALNWDSVEGGLSFVHKASWSSQHLTSVSHKQHDQPWEVLCLCRLSQGYMPIFGSVLICHCFPSHSDVSNIINGTMEFRCITDNKTFTLDINTFLNDLTKKCKGFISGQNISVG